MNIADLMSDAAPQLGTDNPSAGEMAAFQSGLAGYLHDQLAELAVIRQEALIHGTDEQLDVVEGLQATLRRQQERAEARYLVAHSAVLAAAA